MKKSHTILAVIVFVIVFTVTTLILNSFFDYACNRMPIGTIGKHFSWWLEYQIVHRCGPIL